MFLGRGGATELTAFDDAVLQTVMPRVQAWEKLNDPQYSGQLKMGEFYDLLRAAGYPDDVAHRAASKRGQDRLDAEVTM